MCYEAIYVIEQNEQTPYYWNTIIRQENRDLGQTQFLGKMGLFYRSLTPPHDKRDLFPPKRQVSVLNVTASTINGSPLLVAFSPLRSNEDSTHAMLVRSSHEAVHQEQLVNSIPLPDRNRVFAAFDYLRTCKEHKSFQQQRQEGPRAISRRHQRLGVLSRARHGHEVQREQRCVSI